ncbi:DUF4255 domain-containing protein [Chitinophaga sp. Cy-1792]|uniref:DUF4255 domain-containing protein n=1 Tax=Chitinophaga sp. Cy-1792 TaxID=2608339 RepID=UPI0014216196|nr:DUF4255 domain-containing protein [Chitinophaga sp. Cy-1792]NIG53832.1 DUF4255 domain-containing protein [Chitinophaga sp. Cy-1792]
MLIEALKEIKKAINVAIPEPTFDFGYAALPTNQAGVTLSVLNLKEEPTLKNNAYSRVNNTSLKTEYFNPYVYLNVYLLFCSTRTPYLTAVEDIAKIIRKLQEQSTFSVTYGPDIYKINLSIYSPTFEDMNHIWGVLGGKVYPNVIYIMRVAELKSEKPVTTGDGVIENIGQKYNVIQPKQ